MNNKFIEFQNLDLVFKLIYMQLITEMQFPPLDIFTIWSFAIN